MNQENDEKESPNREGTGATMGPILGAGVGTLSALISSGSGLGLAMGLVFGGGIGLVLAGLAEATSDCFFG